MDLILCKLKKLKDDLRITPSFNYTLAEMPQLMYKAGLFDTGDLKRKYYNKNSWNTANDPGVKTWCWFSFNVRKPYMSVMDTF